MRINNPQDETIDIKVENRNPVIKHSVFNFYEVKEPRITPNLDPKTNSYYIQRPNFANSTFVSAVTPASTYEEAVQALSNAVNSFSPLNSVDEIAEVNSFIPLVAAVVQKFKHNLDVEQFSDELKPYTQNEEDIVFYTEEQLELLWDNIYYYTITQRSTVILNYLVALVQTDHFGKALRTFMDEEPTEPENPEENRFTAEVKEHFERIAQARVMIPQVLFPKQGRIAAEEPEQDKNGNKALVQSATKLICLHQYELHQNIAATLSEVQSVYDSKNREALAAAQNAHRIAVDEAYDNATRIEDPETGEVTWENLVLPEYSVTALDIHSTEFTGLLSEQASGYYLKFRNTDINNFNGLIANAERLAADAYKKYLNTTIKTQESVNFKGTTISVSKLPVMPKAVFFAEDGYENNSVTYYALIYLPNTDDWATELLFTANEQTYTAKQISQHDKFSLYAYKHQQTEGESFWEQFSASLKTGQEVTLTSDITGFLKQQYATIELQLTPTTGTTNPRWWADLGAAFLLDGEPGIGKNPLYGVTKLGIIEYKRVEQELCCYVEGEVSHIENILAREHKKRISTSRILSETTTEETEEREVENQTDTTSTDRYELQQEVTKVLEQAKTHNFGGRVDSNVSGGTGIKWSVNMGAYYDGSISSSGSTTFNKSESFAKEIVERAMERVLRKTTNKRTSRMLREYTDTNEHGFDNRLGKRHVTGIYRWVDKLYKNYLINYGKRLVYEFAIPEPAKNWKELITKSLSGDFNKTQPVKPEWPANITEPSKINKTNYASIAALFGAEVNPCPDMNTIHIGLEVAEIVINENKVSHKEGLADIYLGAYKYKIDIPDDYLANVFHITGSATRHGSPNTPKISVSVGDAYTQSFSVWGTYPTQDFKTGANYVIKDHEKSVPVAITTRDISVFALNCVVECKPKPDLYTKWQAETYLAIKKAYENKLKDYAEQLALWQAEKSQYEQNKNIQENTYTNNPLINRLTEQSELKRAAITYMLRQASIVYGVNFYGPKGHCDQYALSSAMLPYLDRYAETVKFMEDAFDWGLMDYTFHPYYWGNCQQWKQLLQASAPNDFLFEAFLQSGLATLRVPVRGGYEKAVMFFLDTGRIWKQGDALVQDLNRVYRTVDQMLAIHADKVCCKCEQENASNSCCTKKEDICIEAKWMSRVPTTLTIVQDYAAPLNRNGLPCFDKNDPRIKFCEDGTPIANLEENDNPNNGIMVGATNTNAATLLQTLNELLQAGQPILDVISELIKRSKEEGETQSKDCTWVSTAATNATDNYNTIIAAYNDGNGTATLEETIAELLSLRNTITSDTGRAMQEGCPVAPLNTVLSLIVGKLDELQPTPEV